MESKMAMLGVSVLIVLAFILLWYVFDCCSHGYKFKDMIKFITVFKVAFFCDEKAKEKLEKFRDIYDKQREYDNQMNQLKEDMHEFLSVAMLESTLNLIRHIENKEKEEEEKEKYKNIEPEIYVDYLNAELKN